MLNIEASFLGAEEDILGRLSCHVAQMPHGPSDLGLKSPYPLDLELPLEIFNEYLSLEDQSLPFGPFPGFVLGTVMERCRAALGGNPPTA